MVKRAILAVVLVFLAVSSKGQGTLTLQVGSPPPAPLAIVQPGDSWQFRKGTNAPQADWKTTATLDASWTARNGGFGYSDSAAEVQLCQTILGDMQGGYSTIYIRKTFTVGAEVDPKRRLVLTMDYDDGFIAWINGAFKASANSPGSPSEPLFSATATATHESSRGSSGQPAVQYDLGEVGLLGVGSHTLAIIGLNQSRSSSSDFVLVPKLELVGGDPGAVTKGRYLALVKTNSVVLSGTNALTGSTKVVVNGDDASFSQADSKWSRNHPLRPGANQVYVAALDENSQILGSTNYLLISEMSGTTVSGTLGASTTWSKANGIIHLGGTVVLPAGGMLTIEPGTVLLATAGASIIGTNATITAQGTVDEPIYFLPEDGTSIWGSIRVSGTNGVLNLKHVETIQGSIDLQDGSTGTLEDSYFHDYVSNSPPIVRTRGVPNPVTLTMLRCHVANYYEMLCQESTNYIDNCLFENILAGGDGTDFDGAFPGSYVRNCTYRHGNTTNIDALDMGEAGTHGSTALIDSCLIHDFVDKGVSMGVAVQVTVTNTLIYDVDSGIAVKDNSQASLFNNTIANVNFGYNNYNKADSTAASGGGHIVSSYNNIIWNVANTTISLKNGSTAVAEYSDFQGTNFSGLGNISADPLFLNVAARDFRVARNSPTLGTGRDGQDMGVKFPVGGLPGRPLHLAARSQGVGPIELWWQDDSENETAFVIQHSTDAINWTALSSPAANVVTFTDNSAQVGVRTYYRVKASNTFGESAYSNIAGAERMPPTFFAGGTITGDKTWPTGTDVIVTNTVTVAAGATLRIEPGVKVSFNTGQGLTVANGGRLLAEGTAAAPILFTRSATTGYWGNLRINGAIGSPETRISYAHFEFNANSTGTFAIEVNAGTVFFDHLTFGNTNAPYIEVDGSSFVIQNCVFPSTTAGFEAVHGAQGIRSDGHGIFTRNYFGQTRGYNDVVDFTGGNRPGPILHFLNNVFLGASDDHLDLDGTDAWVEGNIFMHAHKNGSPDTASAVSGGRDGTVRSEVTIVGNIFYDCDQAAMAKEGNYYTLLNNTIVRQTHEGGLDTDGGVVCLSDEGTPEGAGMYLEGNVVYIAEQLVRGLTNAVVTWTNNIIPIPWNGPGGGNIVANPLLKYIPQLSETYFPNWAAAQVMWDWFTLLPASPGIGTGPEGRDQGIIPIGVSVTGGPVGVTTSRSATLKVGSAHSGSGIPLNVWPDGSGYTHYKWRLNDGAWSEERPISQPITLTGLADGTYYVEVIGRRDSGLYQNDPRFGPDAVVTRSATWTVQTDPVAPALQAQLTPSGTLTLKFFAEAGQGYRVEYSNAVTAAGWSELQLIAPQAASGEVQVEDASLSGVDARFYRVVAFKQI